MNSPKEFEQRVQRVHQLLEGSGANVKWNDHIADPDNPTQTRQIDVSIRREGGLLTLVECRFHARPQDVKWIEELVGRRSSLGAHAVVAVSSSGFTAGAKRKAIAHGVALREFRSLTEQEIRSWGEPPRIQIHYVQFLQIDLSFGFPSGLQSSHSSMGEALGASVLVQVVDKAVEIASEMGEHSGESENGARIVKLNAEFALSGVEAANFSEARAKAAFLPYQRRLPRASVVAYDEPDVDPAARATHVTEFAEGLFEIAQSRDRAGIALDLGTLDAPKNCFVYGALVELGQSLMVQMQVFGTKLPTFELGVVRTGTHPAPISGAGSGAG